MVSRSVGVAKPGYSTRSEARLLFVRGALRTRTASVEGERAGREDEGGDGEHAGCDRSIEPMTPTLAGSLTSRISMPGLPDEDVSSA